MEPERPKSKKVEKYNHGAKDPKVKKKRQFWSHWLKSETEKKEKYGAIGPKVKTEKVNYKTRDPKLKKKRRKNMEPLAQK